MLISLLTLMRNISKHHFPGGGVVLNSVMDIHSSKAEEGPDQNRMAVYMRDGQNFSLCRDHK